MRPNKKPPAGTGGRMSLAARDYHHNPETEDAQDSDDDKSVIDADYKFAERIFDKLLSGRNAHGLQGSKGRYRHQRRLLTFELFQQHLNQELTLAVQVLEPNDTCRLLAFDADNTNGKLQQLYDLLTSKGIHPLWIEGREGRDGHLFMILDAPLDGDTARLFTSSCQRLIDCPNNDQTGAKAIFGGLIRFPLGLNRKLEANGAIGWIKGIDHNLQEQIKALSEWTFTSPNQIHAILDEHSDHDDDAHSAKPHATAMSHGERVELYELGRHHWVRGLTAAGTSHGAYKALSRFLWDGCPDLGIPAYGPNDKQRAELIIEWARNKSHGFNTKVSRGDWAGLRKEIETICKHRSNTGTLQHGYKTPARNIAHFWTAAARKRKNEAWSDVLLRTYELLRSESRPKKWSYRLIANHSGHSINTVIQCLQHHSHYRQSGAVKLIKIDTDLLDIQVREIKSQRECKQKKARAWTLKTQLESADSHQWSTQELQMLKKELDLLCKELQVKQQVPGVSSWVNAAQKCSENPYSPEKLSSERVVFPVAHANADRPKLKGKVNVYPVDDSVLPLFNPYTRTWMSARTHTDREKILQQMERAAWSASRQIVRMMRNRNDQLKEWERTRRSCIAAYLNIGTVLHKLKLGQKLEWRYEIQPEKYNQEMCERLTEGERLATIDLFMHSVDEFLANEYWIETLTRAELGSAEAVVIPMLKKLQSKLYSLAITWDRTGEYQDTLKFRYGSPDALSFHLWRQARSKKSEDEQRQDLWRIHCRRIKANIGQLEILRTGIYRNEWELDHETALRIASGVYWKQQKRLKEKRLGCRLPYAVAA